MQFLYFLPGLETRPAPADYLARGLPHLADAAGLMRWALGNGPGDRRGMFIVRDTPDSRAIQMRRGESDWVQGPDEAFWLTVQRDVPPPCAASLARADMLNGHQVQLADGGFWQIPLAFFAETGEVAFPQRFGLNEKGETVAHIEARCKPLADIADQVWQAGLIAMGLAEGPMPMQSLDELIRACSALLAANYWGGFYEFNALQLFTPQGMGAILSAVCDGPNIERLLCDDEAGRRRVRIDTEKKTTAAGRSIAAGVKV